MRFSPLILFGIGASLIEVGEAKWWKQCEAHTVYIEKTVTETKWKTASAYFNGGSWSTSKVHNHHAPAPAPTPKGPLPLTISVTRCLSASTSGGVPAGAPMSQPSQPGADPTVVKTDSLKNSPAATSSPTGSVYSYDSSIRASLSSAESSGSGVKFLNSSTISTAGSSSLFASSSIFTITSSTYSSSMQSSVSRTSSVASSTSSTINSVASISSDSSSSSSSSRSISDFSTTSPTTSLPSLSSSSSSPAGTASSSTTVVSSSAPSSSSTTSSSVAPSASAVTFLLGANAPTAPLANGYFAQVVSGALSFVATSNSAASAFSLDAAGHLVYNGLYGQITSGTVSQVQFVNAVTTLNKRQTTAAALTCTVTADGTGAASLSCSANGEAIQQVCGTSFYLGANLECQPLIIGYLSSDATTTGVSPSTPGTASASFELKYGTTSYYALYASSSGGGIGLFFNRFGGGPFFNLDANGNFVSIGPTSSGATVPYVGVFPIGSTLGPIIEQTGVVPAGYVPIVCKLTVNTVDSTTALTCVDGANGVNTVLQVCGTQSAFYLGATLGTGCNVPVFYVRFAT